MRSEYGVSGVCLMYPAQLVFLAHTLVSTLDVRTLRVNKSAVCDNVPPVPASVDYIRSACKAMRWTWWLLLDSAAIYTVSVCVHCDYFSKKIVMCRK